MMCARARERDTHIEIEIDSFGQIWRNCVWFIALCSLFNAVIAAM